MSDYILIIEDDRFLQQNLVMRLKAEDYRSEGVASGEEALERLEQSVPDLIVLDLGLPGMDGMTTCRRIRKKWNMPILMLTARTDAMDKVLGLETGADDYLSKPFDAMEFVARIRALLRRSKASLPLASGTNAPPFCLGELAIDFDRRSVTVGGKPIDMTSREYEMLVYLAQNCGRAISREQLLQHVWGYEMEFVTNSLDVHAYRIRKKLETGPNQPKYIHTVRGYGYKLSLER